MGYLRFHVTAHQPIRTPRGTSYSESRVKQRFLKLNTSVVPKDAKD